MESECKPKDHGAAYPMITPMVTSEIIDGRLKVHIDLKTGGNPNHDEHGRFAEGSGGVSEGDVNSKMRAYGGIQSYVGPRTYPKHEGEIPQRQKDVTEVLKTHALMKFVTVEKLVSESGNKKNPEAFLKELHEWLWRRPSAWQGEIANKRYGKYAVRINERNIGLIRVVPKRKNAGGVSLGVEI